VKSFFSAIFGVSPDAPRTARRLAVPERPRLLYAIGDVHGCLDALLALEARIVADAGDAEGEKWLVHLGDYVDRGPQSAEVIEHLLGPAPDGFRRICLCGNHDAAMLGVLHGSLPIEDWLALGGDATLRSYGLDPRGLVGFRLGRSAASRRHKLLAHIPEDHIAFLEGLPYLLTVPGYVFVHAGLWIRDEFLLSDHDFGVRVVHGHTIAEEPELLPHRIGLDTGCFATGRLTALRIDAGGRAEILG
jgi:serine/threonine protein phosphatase 1